MPEFPEGLTFFTAVQSIHTDGVLNADVHFDAQVTKGLAVQADLSPEVYELLLRRVSAWRKVRRWPTVIVAVDESASAETLTPTHTFAAGTSHEDALVGAGYVVADG